MFCTNRRNKHKNVVRQTRRRCCSYKIKEEGWITQQNQHKKKHLFYYKTKINITISCQRWDTILFHFDYRWFWLVNLLMLSMSCDYYVNEAIFCMILQMYYSKSKVWSLFQRYEIYLDDTENTVKPAQEVTSIKQSPV